MSPYLHYGQISPVALALRVQAAATGGEDDKAAYLEELIVRRELAMNHIFYEPNYDSYEAAPAWARKTSTRTGATRGPTSTHPSSSNVARRTTATGTRR